MREKLIELIRKADKEDYESRTQDEHYAFMADLLIAKGVTIPVRCKDCKHGIWDEEEQMWECILSVDLTGDSDTYARFHEYNDGEHFCSYGERKDNG